MFYCPICKESSSYDFAAKYVDVNRCGNLECGHLFAVNVKPYSGVHNYEEEMKTDFSTYQERNNALINYWKRVGFIKPQFKILDFGSGTGHILRSLKNQIADLEITSIEFNKMYQENLMNIGMKVFDTIDNLPETEKFDAILIIEVIEHLDNPLEILKQLKKRLKQTGKLFLTTPAGDLRHPYKNKSELSAYESPFHVQFFTEKSLSNCFKLAGFKKVSYRYIDELYPGRDRQGLQAKYRTLKMYYSFWKGYAGHLTYFAS